MQPFDSGHPAIQLFQDLLVPAPSGQEEQIAGLIRDKIEQIGYSHRTDPSGNVIVSIPGKDPEAPLHCLAAHMDEISMVVTHIEADGLLRVERSGGLYPWKLGEGPVEILGDRESLLGVLSMGSTHVGRPSAENLSWSTVRVMTGLSVDELRNAGVRPGTALLPARERRGPVFFGSRTDPLVAAWTFDDRMGVVTLLRLLAALKEHQLQPYHPTLIAFTVHEESGGNGAKSLAHREAPEVFIAVDGAPMPPEAQLELDGRPAIWSKDRLAHYDRRLVREFLQIGEQTGSGLQTVVYNSAASDASLVSYAGAAPRVACIGHVRQNSHGFEVARLSVFDNLLNILTAFLGRPQP